MKSMMKRSLAVVMVLAMLLSMLAIPAFAATVDHNHNDNEPCGHNDFTTVTEAPTCGEYGGDWNYCNVCDDVWVTNLKAPTGEHDYDNTVIEPTCTEGGYTTSKCKVCGDEKNSHSPVDALGHDWKIVAEDLDDAYNCVVGGTYDYECQREGCNATKTETTESKGHEYVLDDEDYVAPNCDNDGYVVVYCKNCDKEPFEIVLAALGHTGSVLPGKDSDCVNPGYEAGVKCEHFLDADQDGHPDAYDEDGNPVLCSEVPGPVIPAKGHDWALVGTPDAEGYIYVKTVDGVLTVVDAETEGAEKVLQVYEGVCSESNYEMGWKYEYCRRCDLIEKHEVEPTHDEEFVKTVPPTCTEQGYDVYMCNECEKTFKKNYVPAQHKYTVSADVLASGKVIYTYVKDGVILMDGEFPKMTEGATPDAALVAEGYVAVIWMVQQKYECGKTGIYVHACEVCGATENFMISSEHIESTDPGYERVVVAPTCDTYGFTQATCGLCGADYEVEGSRVSPLGHMNQDGTRVPLVNGNAVAVVIPQKNATCTEPGCMSYSTCFDDECDLYGSTGTVINPTGHSYTGETAVVANCKLPAYKVPSCANLNADGTVCGKLINTDEDYNPGLAKTAWEMRVPNSEVGSTPDVTNHDWVETGARVEPTCAANGKEASYTCSLCNMQQNGAVIPQLTEPTWAYNKTNENATCTENGYWVKYCEGCATLSEKVHADEIIIKETATGVHYILGGVYMEDEDGNYLTDSQGVYYVDLSGATPVEHPEINSEHPATEGTCNEAINDFHRNAYACRDCGEAIVFSVRPAHTPDGSASCTDAVHCTVCTALLSNELGHDYSTVVDVIDPTCTTPGYTIYECDRCGDVTDADDAMDHVDEKGHVPGAAATCEKDQICTRTECGAILTPKTNHNLTSVVVTPATCLRAEYTTYTCSNENCDHADTDGVWEVENGDPVDHDMVNLVVRDADCLLFGVVTKICKDCRTAVSGSDFEASRGHNLVEHTTAADCENDGLIWMECDQCAVNKVDWKGNTNYSVVETLPAYGHSNDKGDALSMDCSVLDDIALEDRICNNAEHGCGKVFDLDEAHDYHKVTVQATCQVEGISFEYCTVCGIKSIDGDSVLPTVDHKPVENVAARVEPTYTEKGTKYFWCEYCHCDMGSEPIDALDAVNFIGSVANKFGAEALIVNKSVIAYTISMEALDKYIFGVEMTVAFDSSKLTYLSYDLGEDGVNAFGTSATTLADASGNAVHIIAFSENTADGKAANAKIDGTSEFITLYFQVNADSVAESVFATGYETAIEMDKNNIYMIDVDGEDYSASVENADDIVVNKLGDVNNDGVIGLNDVMAVKNLITKTEYDARADIDQDGDVDIDDLAAINRYIIKTYDYAAFLAFESAEQA